MKRIMTLFLCIILLITCTSCGKVDEKNLELEPQISQMKSICELAVMECYYHNVAKYKEEDASGVLFWKKDKHFWIEYSGIVELGIDASLVNMEINDDTVTITIPKAKVLDCTVDSKSLTKDSFIVDQDSAKINAEDETAAFEEAQSKMEEAAQNDQVLLDNAQQRVQTLLENYVKNIGKVVGKEYIIRWSFLNTDGDQEKTIVEEPLSDAKENEEV